MPPFSHHLFICGNQRSAGHARGCCDCEGHGRLRKVFKQELARRGLKGVARANSAGCLDQCEYGPVVVIYPQQVWYGQVREEDVSEIVERTVLRGEVLEHLQIPDEALNTKGAVPWQRADEPGES